MLKNGKFRGFTLAEMMLVIFLVILLTGAALTGMIRSQQVFIFNGADQQIQALVREARSLAVTGKAQPDFTDYDGDGCMDENNHVAPCTMAAADNDYVTPVNYGVYFDDDNVPNKVILFADIHEDGGGLLEDGSFDNPGAANPVGVYSPGNDLVLSVYELPESLSLIIDPDDGNNQYGVLYSPIFADVSFDDHGNGWPALFFKYGLEEVNGGTRSRCAVIHPVSGVPELLEKADPLDTCP